MIKQDAQLRLQVVELVSADFMGELEAVCHSRLRHLPGRRSVWKARCEGVEILLKLYDPHPKQARDAGLEWRNAVELQTLGLNIPEPLFFAKTEDGFLAVAMAFIPDGVTLDEALAVAESEPEVKETMFNQLVSLHSKQHDCGCYQSDDHLGNYLWSRGQLWMLDAGSYLMSEGPLAEMNRVKNMAMLAANVPLPWRSHYDAAFEQFYDVKIRGLESAIPDAIQIRVKNYYKKTRRSCTEFEHEQSGGVDWLACRDMDPALKAKLLTNPDQFFEEADQNDLLKNGNTCTVVEVVEGGRFYILKRYNQKSLGYRLRHLLMTPRAILSWSNGHVLRLFGVPTPRPIACLLLKTGWMVRRGYLLMEKVTGVPLSNVAEDSMSQASQRLPQQFAQRWGELDALGATHGDMKASNFIVDEQDVIVLIDLDSLQFHRPDSNKLRRQLKDMKRFMQNWKALPKVTEAYREALESWPANRLGSRG